jgi:hypothetical protein
MTMALIALSAGFHNCITVSGDKDKGDADIRQDFPGGWLGDENNAFTKGPYFGQNQYFDFTSKLFQWRKPTKRYILVK